MAPQTTAPQQDVDQTGPSTDLSTSNQPAGTTRIESGVAYDASGKALGPANEAPGIKTNLAALATQHGGAPADSPAAVKPDYAALARQFGGEPAKVDYAALAKKFGGAPAATPGKSAPEQTDDLLTNAIAYSNPMMTAAHLAGNKGIESAHLVQARNVANYIYNDILGKDTYTHNNIQYDPTPSSNYEKIKQRLWSPFTQDEINKIPGLEPDRVEMLREQGQDILGRVFGKEKADYLREHILNGSYAVNVPPEEFARAAAKSLTDWFSPGAQALRGFGLAAQGYAKAGQVAADAGDMVKAAQAMGKARLLGLLGTAVNVPFATSQAHDLVANWDKMSVPERVAAVSGIMSAAINTHVGVEQAGGYKQASQDAYADTKGTVSDAVAATRKALGAASDTALRAAPTTTDAIIRASQLGGKGYEKQKANVVKAGPAIDKILTENPNVQGPGETAQAIHRWVQAREADLQNVSHATKDSAEPVSPTLETDVRTSLDKFFAENKGQYGNDEQVEKAKQAILSRIMQGTAGDPNNPLRMPNAFEAENIRRGLNNEVTPQTGGEPTTNAYRAAANETVKTLRESIDGFYHRNGVKNVAEFRQQEATLIDVAKRLEAAQNRADDMGNGGLWAALYRKIGAPTTIGTIIAGSFHPISFGALAPYLLGERIYQNYKNPNVNIRRAVELANPNAKPIDIEHEEVPPMQGPSAGFPGTVPPGALPPVHPVEAGQAAHAVAPLTQPEPPTNHTLNAKLAEHFGQPLNHVDEDGNPVTLQDRIDHVRSDLEAQRRTGVDVSKTGTGKMNGLITEHEANLANALTEHQEEMREQAAKDAAVRQKENQAAIDKEAAEKKAAAETTEEKNENDLTAHIANPFTPGEEMPISERWKSLVEGISGPRIRAHELGHHIMAALANWLTGDVIGENHPKLSGGKNSLAEARWDDHPFYDEKGKLDLGKVTDNLDQLLDLFHGGAIAEEIVHGVPMAENYGATGDLSKMRGLLKDGLKMQPAEIGAVMKASELRVRKVMSTPGVRDIIDRYTKSREAGLRDDVHMSDETVAKAVEEVKTLLGGGDNGTNNEGKAANGLRGGAEKGEAGRVGGNAPKSEGEAGAAREKGASAGSARRGTERVGGVTEKTKANVAEPEMKVEHRDNAMGGDVRLEGPEGNHGYLAYTTEGPHSQVQVSMVEKGQRGKGYGQQMYEEAAQKIRAKGGETLRSDPAETSADAARVWEKLSEKHPGEITKDADGRYTWDLKKGGETKANIAAEPKTISDKLVDTYGTTDDPHAAGFILSDGRMVPLHDTHNAMLENLYQKYGDIGMDEAERTHFINAEKAVRTRYRMTKGGPETVFSVPKDGVNEAQINQIKQSVGKMRNGNAVMEISEGEGKSTKKEFARVSDVEPMLREIGAHPEDNALKANLGHEAMAGMKATREAEGAANKENENQKGIRETARAYNAERGRPDVNPKPVAEDPRMMKMGEEYAKLEHNPNDPAVKKSYDAFKKEVDQQYDALVKSGFKFDTSEKNPYDTYPEMRKDILQNKHLTVHSGNAPPEGHPMAEVDPKTGLTYNEKFRMVHDVLGHAAHDAEFSGPGEESAWNYHRQMFSPEAQPALASETRGQVAHYMRYGSFPESQKAVLMPEHYNVRPEDLNKGEWAKQVEEKPWGGVNPNNPEAPSKTYGFEIAPEHRHTPGTLTADEARAYAERPEVKELLASHPDIKMGWDTTTGGRPELNIAASTNDLATAKKMARLLDQRVFVNTKTGDEIPAGGKGERTSFPEYPMEQRLNDLKANIAAEPKEEEGFNFGKNAEGTPDQQKGLISTALPKGKKAIADPLETDVRVGMESLTPKSEAAIADKIREMPGFRIPDAIKDPKKVIAKYIDQFKKNLIDVHNRVDPETRAATAKWYESANGIAQRTAEKFGKTLKQGAGILAALSPQKDWDQNVSLAERVNDIYHTKGDMRMTPEMRAKVDQLVGEKHTDEEGNVTRKNDKLGNLVDSIGDRSFNELSNPLEKAAFIRLYDEAHNPREFHRIDPGTGNRAEIVTTDSGAPRRIAWGSLNEISKAVSILEDGSRENISNNLGGSHKVRNFYNNILDPNNPAGHVTVDTHAVAAGHQRMLGGKSPEVKANFGGISAAETGLKGMYAVNAEAYRQAAKELGLQPRQLQSIVWEEIRKQFPDEYKRSTTAQAAIDGIWKEYEDGDITLKNAQQRVRDYAQKGYAEMVANKPAAKEAARPQANWDWEKIGLLPSNFVKSGK